MFFQHDIEYGTTFQHEDALFFISTGNEPRYNKLDETQFSGQESLEELIGKLIAISREKKEIQAESNAIIREYVTQYDTSQIVHT